MSKNVIIAAVILVIALAAVYFLPKTGNQTGALSAQNVVAKSVAEFKIDAKRWEYSPSVITVKKGDKVKITINNTDTKHGINLPDFNVSDDDSVEFIADKTGEFNFYCNVYCGKGHPDMQGKIIVSE